MDQLQILQNKAAKTILDAPYLSSSTEALDKLYCIRFPTGAIYIDY